MLNLDQLKAAVAEAKQRFDLIRQKHPELKAYLVMSSPKGQTGIDKSPAEILGEFPSMVIDDDAKAAVLEHLSSHPPQTKTGPKTERRLKKELDQLASHLQYDETCQIELRFHDLNYDLVWKLQTDDLVDHNLTPQTKASIRIVLGTLAHFGGTISKETR